MDELLALLFLSPYMLLKARPGQVRYATQGRDLDWESLQAHWENAAPDGKTVAALMEASWLRDDPALSPDLLSNRWV